MADASFLRTNFHGGEWSPYSQGRADRPDYRTGMNVSLNGLPLEEGAWTRRPGLQWLGNTRAGHQAVLRAFHFNQASPYAMEFTGGFLRLWKAQNLVGNNDSTAVTSAEVSIPAMIFHLESDPEWVTGDEIAFAPVSGTPNLSGLSDLLNKTFFIDVLSCAGGGYCFSLKDTLTGANFTGATVDIDAVVDLVAVKILTFSTPWTSPGLDNIRTLQDDKTVLIMRTDVKPWLFTTNSAPTTIHDASFLLAPQDFQDGPYMDPVTDGATISISCSGSERLVTISDITNEEFLETDVGRHMRFFSEPAAWDVGTTYAQGDTVKYTDGNYYTAQDAVTGNEPDTSPDDWLIAPNGATWTWGVITGVIDAANATMQMSGGDFQWPDQLVRTWRFGLYSETTGWPTLGVYHDGRLWLASNVVPNRLDASKSNDHFNFSPTAPDGTVADDNAIAAVFQATDTNPILWLVEDEQGLTAGTQAGEWIIRSTAFGDPITPTNILARRPTKYGSSNVVAERIGGSTLFVDRFALKLLEYTADPSTVAKYSAVNLSLQSKHIVSSGIAELVYQRELTPMVWVRLGNGGLAGMAYQRDGTYAQAPNSYTGWVPTSRTDGRVYESIQGGPGQAGLDALMVVTNDPTTGIRQVELLTLIMGQKADPATWCGLDAATVPVFAVINDAGTGMTYYGLHNLAGQTVSAWIGGLDLGEVTVGTNGQVTVPFTDTFTTSFLASLDAEGLTFYGLGVVQVGGSIPSYTKVSQWSSGLIPGTFNGNSIRWQLPIAFVFGFFMAAFVAPATNVFSGGYTAADDQIVFFGAGDPDDPIIVDQPTLYGATETALGLTAGTLGLGPLNYAQTSEFSALNGMVYLPVTQFPYDVSHSPPIAPIQILQRADLLIGTSSTYFGTAADVDWGAPITDTTWSFPTSWGMIETAASTFLPVTTIGVQPEDGHEVPPVLQLMMGYPNLEYTGKSYEFTDYPGGTVSYTRYGAGGVGYAIVQPSALLAPTSDPIGLFQITVDDDSNLTVAKLYDFVPSDFGEQFNGFNHVPGDMMIDASDGNLIVQLNLSNEPNPPGEQIWTIKIDVNTGTMVWKITDLVPLRYQDTSNGQIVYITSDGADDLDPWDFTSRIHTISTADGRTQFPISDVGGESITSGVRTNNLTAGNTYSSTVQATSIYAGATDQFFAPVIYAGPPPGPADDTTAPSWTTPQIAEFIKSGEGPSNYFVPAIFGYGYPSRGQILRPIEPQEAGAQNGPALAKTRRAHQYGALVQRTGPITWGTDFTRMDPSLTDPRGNTLYVNGALYDGLLWTSIEDDYSFDSMVGWEITRPGPATVLMVGSFLHTQDR